MIQQEEETPELEPIEEISPTELPKETVSDTGEPEVEKPAPDPTEKPVPEPTEEPAPGEQGPSLDQPDPADEEL